MDFLDYFFFNLFSIVVSVTLFLGTIRFGDNILAIFKK